MSMSFGGPSAGAKDQDKLQIFLNDKPDVLTAIVKHRTQIRGHLGHLYISSFDKEGKFVTILYHPPPSGEEKVLELQFKPPLKDAFEARPRLMAYRDQALEHFDVPKIPAIKYYSLPSPWPATVPLVIAITALLLALFGRGQWADLYRAKIAQYGGKGLLPGATAFAATVHFIIYPIYLIIKLPQHRVPFVPALKWTITTLVLGIAGLNEFWNCVEYEKIRHIYARTDVGKLPPRVGVEKAKKE